MQTTVRSASIDNFKIRFFFERESIKIVGNKKNNGNLIQLHSNDQQFWTEKSHASVSLLCCIAKTLFSLLQEKS
jgi:hypothetical protein